MCRSCLVQKLTCEWKNAGDFNRDVGKASSEYEGIHGQYRILMSVVANLVKDIKVIPDEKCVTQHRLQVFELNLKIKENVKKSYVPKLRTQKLKDSDINEVFVKSSNDTFENYRFSATLILLMIYGKISRVLPYQT